MTIHFDHFGFINDTTCVINSWLRFSHRNDFYFLLNLFKDHNVDAVVISNIHESSHTFGNTLCTDKWVEFYNFCKSINIKFQIILGTLPPNDNTHHTTKFHTIYGKDTFYYPFIGIDEVQFHKKQLLKENNIQYFKNGYKFSCLMGKSRPHRILLFDHLTKYKLVKDNIVSFVDNYPNEIDFGDWLFVKEFEPVLLDYKGDITKIPLWKLPDGYFESFLDIIVETSYDYIQFTEKTFKSIFFKKPFIVYGGPGSNLSLKNMGFELFDEIFDYDYFDNIASKKEFVRADYLSSFLKSFNNLIYTDSVKEKIEHNYQKLMNFDDRYFLDSNSKIIDINSLIPNKKIKYDKSNQEFVVRKKMF